MLESAEGTEPFEADVPDHPPGSGKADFGSVYNQPDARAYYSALGAVDYQIPQHGADVFRRLFAAYRMGAPDRPLTVLDLCCSYGVGGALAKTDLDLYDLYRHYEQADRMGATTEQLIRADAELLARHRRPAAPRVIGLDVADNAARYGVATGALDEAFVENLEEDEPSTDLADMLREVDLIVATGGVGYITWRTFARLMQAAPATAWVAAFCLRTYDYQPIADALAGHGLVTERAAYVYPQRRFLDGAEQRWALAQLAEQGLDPTGLESEGSYFAGCYLSRPEREARERPLQDLIPDAPRTPAGPLH